MDTIKKLELLATEGITIRLKANATSQEEGRGWGCGYVQIPLEHPFMIHKDLDKMYSSGILHEITWSQPSKQKSTHWEIGFDTAHSWNGPEHDKDYVQENTIDLAMHVARFNKIDATVLLSDWLDEQKEMAISHATDLCKTYKIEL